MDDLREALGMDAVMQKLDSLASEVASLRSAMQPDRVQWLTVQQYAEINGVSAETVRRHCRQGKLETKRNGRSYLIRRG